MGRKVIWRESVFPLLYVCRVLSSVELRCTALISITLVHSIIPLEGKVLPKAFPPCPHTSSPIHTPLDYYPLSIYKPLSRDSCRNGHIQCANSITYNIFLMFQQPFKHTTPADCSEATRKGEKSVCLSVLVPFLLIFTIST